MFHHPATWWISHVIRREREHCCDDIAVAACRDRLVYARALAAMEGLRVPVFSLSPAASGGNLLARIRRILNPVEESMKPGRTVVAMFAVLAIVPIWLVRAGERDKADPGSPRPDLVMRKSSPSRTVADTLTAIEEEPKGPFTTGGGREPAQPARFVPSNAILQSGTISDAAASSAESPSRDSLNVYSADAGGPEDPPSETEVWAKMVPLSKDHAPPFFKVERKNVRTVVEKIGDRIDPVRVYPLVGPCQLVHRHYKCTVYFDQVLLGGLSDRVEPRRSQGRSRLHQQGLPAQGRRAGGAGRRPWSRSEHRACSLRDAST